EKIPAKILEVVHNTILDGHDEKSLLEQNKDVYKQILSLLRVRKGTDFSYYKQTTIRRRILRRMAITKNEAPANFLKYLRENKAEQDILYQDLLIPVTSFFRDPKTFENLCKLVFPAILKNKGSESENSKLIRIWVAGCSSGEEVYSMAICLKEFLGDNSVKLQIFGTDISEPAILKARSGIYTNNEIAGLSVERLQEFFIKTSNGYQANKSIRELCVFANHNFLKDPPFGKMDLISCRNVLIYFEPYLQKKALNTFHYALNPNGYLLLGKSETTSNVSELFTSAGSGEKIFSRKDAPSRFMYTASARIEQNITELNVIAKMENPKKDFQKTADEIMLSRFTPAGVVVNEAMDIVQFRGKTGNYLEQSSGKPSHNLIKMAKDGLAFELRNILHKVKKDKSSVIKDNIPININGTQQYITIEALILPDTIEPFYLILFHDHNADLNVYTSEKVKKINKTSLLEKKEINQLRIEQLENELAQSREDMRSITEEQEAANEELQSANEELLSGSEELQSLNEEMETSKEELQSTNEELIIVNQEMISLNEQITYSRDYAESIIATIHQPLLVLDINLRIKTASAAFYKVFHVNDHETVGELIYDLGNKQWDIPQLRTLLESLLPEKESLYNFEVEHTFPTLGQRFMLLNASEITREKGEEKLILLAIQDITEIKKAEDILKNSREHFRKLVKELPAAVYSCDAAGNINFYNDAAIKIWGHEPEIGKEKWCGSKKILKPDGTQISLDKSPLAIAFKEGHALIGEEIAIERTDGTQSIVLVHPQLEYNLSGEITGAINMMIDVTEQVNARKKVEESEMELRQMADFIPQKISTSDSNGNRIYFNRHWLNYTDLSFDELKGSGWRQLIYPDDMEATIVKWDHSIQEGIEFEVEFRMLNKSGEYRWQLSQSTPIKDDFGITKKWINSTIDIHDRKEESQRKDDFIKMVSHELKTPVTSIKGYVQILLMMLEQQNESQNSELFKTSLIRIEKQVLKLTRLITEMLDLSRLEDSKLELQKEIFEINSLVAETIDDIHYTNSNHDINLHQDFHGFVEGDRDRIGQVLINFIANAIKYSPENKAIDVRIEEADHNFIAVSINDFGIGIEEKDHEKIFDRFYRVGGKNEQTYPGFGIGLFIAKSIIERHQGFITVVSKKDEGAKFTFYLPLISVK
nr:PAS domain S-box protein [Chitinophagales bacterium]